MNSDSSALTVFGMSEAKPVIFELETTTSKILKYIELELDGVNEDDLVLGGIYSDKNDQGDYIYASYLTKKKPTVLRLNPLDGAQTSIDWSFDINEYSGLKISTLFDFFIPDRNSDALWLAGIYDGKASLYKFKKQSSSGYGRIK